MTRVERLKAEWVEMTRVERVDIGDWRSGYDQNTS